MARTETYIRQFLEAIRDERGTHQNTATRIGTAFLMLLEYIVSIDYPYLRKDIDDQAAGIITFLKGLKLGSADGRYGATAEGVATVLDAIFDRVLQSKGAAKGFDHGHGIYMDALEGLIETDGLNVRGFMRVMELIINRLQLMESDYSFTEGDTVEHIGYEDNGHTLVLRMKRDHENDFTPFYPGDIIYGIVNDLLPKDGTVPDGHSVTRSGASYYRTWMRVKSVNLTDNVLRVALYEGRRESGEAIVPGGTNFSPHGTAITTDAFAPMEQEYAAAPEGYDTMLTVTRHGNVADGLEDADRPDSYSDAVKRSQQGRQQAWVLSTTDRNLTFYWRVDRPIVDIYNYALSLGILPGAVQQHLGGSQATADFTRPSLWVDTIFYDNSHKANFPATIVKEDRGAWTDSPMADYDGQQVPDPYHYRMFSQPTWLRYRSSPAHRSLTDDELRQKMFGEWKVDLEVSRVWNYGALWECCAEGTAEEPAPGCTDWEYVSGATLSLQFFNDDDDSPQPLTTVQVYPGSVDFTVVPYLLMGGYDFSAQLVSQWQWRRESDSPATDEQWNAAARTGRRTLHVTNDDMPPAYTRGHRLAFVCTATVTTAGGETETLVNKIIF